MWGNFVSNIWIYNSIWTLVLSSYKWYFLEYFRWYAYSEAKVKSLIKTLSGQKFYVFTVCRHHSPTLFQNITVVKVWLLKSSGISTRLLWWIRLWQHVAVHVQAHLSSIVLTLLFSLLCIHAKLRTNIWPTASSSGRWKNYIGSHNWLQQYCLLSKT